MVGALLIVLHFTPLFNVLCFEREGIYFNNELWRLLTGHLMHTDSRHLISNIAGLWILAALYKYNHGKYLLLILLITSLCLSLLLIWYFPLVKRYCGLSGVLNSLFVICLLQVNAHTHSKKIKHMLLSILLLYIIKLIFDQTEHSFHFSNNQWPTLGMAHSLGAFIGLGLYCIRLLLMKFSLNSTGRTKFDCHSQYSGRSASASQKTDIDSS